MIDRTTGPGGLEIFGGAPAIVASGLSKSVTVTVAERGLRGALRSVVRPERVRRDIVRDVSLTVRAGELVALLGPNGAGKSTLVKMFTGILVPSGGTLRVNGLVPHRDRAGLARGIGAVFGQRTQLWWDLPARESLDILRDIYGIPGPDHRRRLAEFDEILALRDFWDTPVRHLSLGQRVRCDLAASLVHDPRTVFLDEPTIGMDVVVKEQVREFLRHQALARGRTVVLTTHDTADVAHLCERLVLVDRGRVRFDGTLANLRAAHGGSVTVRAVFAAPVGPVEIEGTDVVERTDLRLTLVPRPGVDHRRVVRDLVGRTPVADLRVDEDDVESLIRNAYRDGRPVTAGGRPGTGAPGR
ncbi:ATP-binding cassette domain-containing protein [Actinomadura graeca]|uniref:ATP-binding cassette domain-containing protein n=1 Tax=Actinomadura graeca TaxID=2750812 RepID=A0ABX8QV97_9ACTN|nr:ATP-binding cassette domain-containing protein [Actinomadura graeca]QXJ22301.1 ATP-binding cassette domain-containing protein [Actinomadura graeca]